MSAGLIVPQRAFLVIKPSGVPYEALTLDDLVVVQLADGVVVEGARRPSSDTPTHRSCIRRFQRWGDRAHAFPVGHRVGAGGTGDSQAGHYAPDFADGAIPCTRDLTPHETVTAFEEHTGQSIVETFRDRDPLATPAVLVKGHGPFCLGALPRSGGRACAHSRTGGPPRLSHPTSECGEHS